LQYPIEKPIVDEETFINKMFDNREQCTDYLNEYNMKRGFLLFIKCGDSEKLDMRCIFTGKTTDNPRTLYDKSGKMRYVHTECLYKIYAKKENTKEGAEKWRIVKTSLHCQEHNHKAIQEDHKILFSQDREFNKQDIDLIMQKYMDGLQPSKIHADLSDVYQNRTRY